MNIAVSVCNDQIAPTLGQTKEFVLLSNGREERFFCTEKIPLFLKKHGVQVLICDGIGNCMFDLLVTMGIDIIPGVKGAFAFVKEQYYSGELKAGEKYSCTDHGQSCGVCAGSF